MRKYFLCLVILLAFATFTYAKGPDMSVMNTGININLTYPTNNVWYNSAINNFNWELLSNTSALIDCRYTLNSVTTIFGCSERALNISSVENINSLSLRVMSLDSMTTDSVVFNIDTLPPQITITSPISPSYNSIVTGLYYTINEANPSSCLYSNDNGQNNHSITCGDNVTSLTSNEGSNIWMVCAKDIVNHEACDAVAFWVDSITPSIQFNPGTTETGDHPQGWIFVNVTCSDTNKESVILNINGTDIAFDENYSDIYWSTETLSDGIYNFYAYCNDSIGHSNQTETRTVTLDTTAPVITLNTPNNSKAFALSDSIIFNFTVDEINPYTCELSVDGSVSVINSGDFILASTLGAGQHYWNINCKDFVNNEDTSDTRVFTVLSDLTFPPGTETPDLTLEPNISSVWFWVKNEFGIINWTQPLDLSRGLDWANYIGLTFNNANVNSILAPELNKQADITFYNISWNSPQIIRNGELCSSEICNPLSYTVNVSYMFNVTSFSTYETRETPVPSYEVSGSGSVCKTNWTCTAWSTCFGNVQTRTCTKIKLFCNTYTDKPAEKQSCIEQKSVNTTQIQQAPEQQETATPPQGGTGITGFITAHPASTAATLIAILGVASYFVVSRIRAKSLKPEPAKTGGKEGVSWITSKSAEKVDSI